MSKHDLNGETGLPKSGADPSLAGNMYDLDDIFDSVDLSEFDFEDDENAYYNTRGHAKKPAPQEPAPSPAEPENEQDQRLSPAPGELDTYLDSGTYRSYDGSSEYRSFDAAMPDAPEDGWYHYSDEDSQLEEEYDVYEEDEEDYDEEYEEEDVPRHHGLKVFANVLLGFITVLAAFYLMVLYSGIPALTNLRNMYVRTAMNTINHKWLATAIVPSDIIDELMLAHYQSEVATEGVESDPNWGPDVIIPPTLSGDHEISAEEAAVQPNELGVVGSSGEIEYGSEEEQKFYEFFHELDYASTQAYFEKHPEALKYGFYYVDINEAGLKDEGTSIKTNQGDQVLAINSQQGLLLIRIQVGGSRGVMAICKDTSRVTLRAATTLPATGQTCGKICENNGGILAITGSAFLDDGTSNGGQISGLAVCNGETYGERLGSGFKRLELRDDNCMYIVDSNSSVGSGTRDASEFQPALIVDGKVVVDENTFYNSPNPRAVLGQTSQKETMMVVVEGRFSDSPGCSVEYVADLMADYDCYQALNLDGGTSAIMYYDGEVITRCSNTAIPNGRTMPSAWVYLSSK